MFLSDTAYTFLYLLTSTDQPDNLNTKYHPKTNIYQRHTLYTRLIQSRSSHTRLDTRNILHSGFRTFLWDTKYMKSPQMKRKFPEHSLCNSLIPNPMRTCLRDMAYTERFHLRNTSQGNTRLASWRSRERGRGRGPGRERESTRVLHTLPEFQDLVQGWGFQDLGTALEKPTLRRNTTDLLALHIVR